MNSQILNNSKNSMHFNPIKNTRCNNLSAVNTQVSSQ